MVCPKCKNRGFLPSEEFPRPIINLGKKEKFASFDTRRYCCVQCGHVFLTKEEYYRDVKVRTQASLFDFDETSSA